MCYVKEYFKIFMRECLKFIEYRLYIDIITFNREIICNKKWKTIY